MATEDQEIRSIGDSVDLATSARNDALALSAIERIDQKLLSSLPPESVSLLYYFRANAWYAVHLSKSDELLKQKNPTADQPSLFWFDESLENQLICLRRSRELDGFRLLSPLRQAQVLVNLGNLLDEIGRFVEATPLFESASHIVPDFGMSLGNHGFALGFYARSHYDTGQTRVMLAEAARLLARALKLPLEEHAISGFRKELSKIGLTAEDRQAALSLLHKRHSLGASTRERAYRKWCLSNGLFLNPLNDLGPYSVAAYDPLGLPDLTTQTSDVPWPFHFFNQIKQEYVAARTFLYESNSGEKHFSNSGLQLVDTFDESLYGLSLEKLRLSYRVAYSLFDKIAFFVNGYLGLGIAEKRINFRTVWYANGNLRDGFHKSLLSKKNWPLRGLFWLSRDLHEDEAEFVQDLEPQARNLRDIRNALEHRSLRLRASPSDVGSKSDLLTKEGRMELTLDGLRSRTLKVLKLARAAMIYLSFSVHWEERFRSKSSPGKKISMTLPTLKPAVGK